MTFSCVALFFPFSLSVSFKASVLSFDVFLMPCSLDGAFIIVKLWSCRWAGPEVNTRGNSNSWRFLWNINAAYLSKLSGADRSIRCLPPGPCPGFHMCYGTGVTDDVLCGCIASKGEQSFHGPFSHGLGLCFSDGRVIILF